MPTRLADGLGQGSVLFLRNSPHENSGPPYLSSDKFRRLLKYGGASYALLYRLSRGFYRTFLCHIFIRYDIGEYCFEPARSSMSGVLLYWRMTGFAADIWAHHTKRRERKASKSIPQQVISIPAKGIKIRLPVSEPRHPPIRSAAYSGEIIFFWSQFHEGWHRRKCRRPENRLPPEEKRFEADRQRYSS